MASLAYPVAQQSESHPPVQVSLPGVRRSFYRPELDVLRFFAFLGVFRYHFAFAVERYISGQGASRWLSIANNVTFAGSFGVDLFFALSAYLITELLLREKEQFGALDVRAFYLRRILRIWPLYFFCIGVALIPFFNPVSGFNWRYLTAFLLLAGNWSIVFWGWPMHSIVNPLWTVSVEEQFYLLWPPIVRKLSRQHLIWIAIAMLGLSTAMRVLMISGHAAVNSVRCNTLTRLDPIAAGILLASVLRGRMPGFRFIVRLAMLCCGLLALVLVAHYWKVQNPEFLVPIPTLIGYPVVAAGCTLILLAVLGIRRRPPGALLYLGKISYGLYVYHALAAFLADKILPVHIHLRQLALRETLGLTITVVLASVSYVSLEQPFLRLKKRFEHIGSRPV